LRVGLWEKDSGGRDSGVAFEGGIVGEGLLKS